MVSLDIHIYKFSSQSHSNQQHIRSKPLGKIFACLSFWVSHQEIYLFYTSQYVPFLPLGPSMAGKVCACVSNQREYGELWRAFFQVQDVRRVGPISCHHPLLHPLQTSLIDHSTPLLNVDIAFGYFRIQYLVSIEQNRQVN